MRPNGEMPTAKRAGTAYGKVECADRGGRSNLLGVPTEMCQIWARVVVDNSVALCPRYQGYSFKQPNNSGLAEPTCV